MTESEIIQQPTSFNVLLIGDSCVDEYFIGSCERLSPEAPVPVLKIKNHYTTNGMASNVLANFRALGWDPDFVTNEGIIKKTRYIDSKSGQHLLRVDDEPNIPLWDGKTNLPLSKYDVIVISDYNKGFLSYVDIERILAQASGPVFIDTKKNNLSRFKGSIIKINETEYKNRISDYKNLIVTLGSEGAMYHNKVYPARQVDVVDVCGAGDTFFASLVFAYMHTKRLDKAIEFANKAGSISVQHRGNYTPSLYEIQHA